MVLRRLRARTALVVGLSITGVMALLLIGLGVPYKLLIDSWTYRFFRNPLEVFPKWWAKLICSICIRWLLGIRIDRRSNLPSFPLGKGEHLVCITNHPSTLALPVLIELLTHSFATRLLIVGKKEHERNPFIGWPMKLIRGMIFIDREDNRAANLALVQGVLQQFTSPGVILIIPDRTRPTAESIKADRWHFEELEEVPSELCTTFPRRGGFFTITDTTGYRLPVVDVTIGLSIWEEGVKDVERAFGETVLLHTEDVTSQIPRNRVGMGIWLARRWARFKNPFLGRARRHRARAA